jgi:hypothetical protein
MDRTAPRVRVDTLGSRLANTSTKLRAIVGSATRLATVDNGVDNQAKYAPIAACGCGFRIRVRLSAVLTRVENSAETRYCKLHVTDTEEHGRLLHRFWRLERSLHTTAEDCNPSLLNFRGPPMWRIELKEPR